MANLTELTARNANISNLTGLETATNLTWLDLVNEYNEEFLLVNRNLVSDLSPLAALMPKETALLANYPNPFNPETWIPYHLANDADVSLSIYDVDGALVRELDLGHQRTAHWDGRNGLGERVASGVYFYTLITDDYTETRRMVIVK